MTTKYKIDFGNGTVLEAEQDIRDFYRIGCSLVNSATLDLIGAKIIPLEEPITITKEQYDKAVLEAKRDFRSKPTPGIFGTYLTALVWEKLKEEAK